MIKTICKVEEVKDFIWTLSQDDLYASYPRKKAVMDIEKEITKAINEDNRSIIACYCKGMLCGVCSYFWEKDNKYAQTSIFLVKGQYGKVANEFIQYIGKQLCGYELLIGVPFSNDRANNYFEKNKTQCIDSSIDTRIYNYKVSKNYICNFVQEIKENNFLEYVSFHDNYADSLQMYYNSKNLRRDIEKFRIFVFKQYEEIHASIFVKASKEVSEVYGLFIDEEYKNKGIESTLINEMLRRLYSEFGLLGEVVYFIEEKSKAELNSALEAGFEIKDRYRCYKYLL